ncbi:hypothetical protein MMC26_005922 [Xylographa opegraphella]|nr:hypothetical protein [Xylographa opegraphella]
MAVVIDLEGDSETSSPSPRSSKKRSYDETLLEDGAILSPATIASKDHGAGLRHDDLVRKTPVGIDAVQNGTVENGLVIGDSAEEEPVENDLANDRVSDVSDQALGDVEIKKTLLAALQNIDDHSAGTFAAFGTLSSAPNPGLYIERLGSIGLPLTASDAHRFVSIGHQAPFGKGSETIVDTTVRRTWELNPSQFRLRNPAWSETVDGILVKAAADLGIEAKSMHAELCKLLLYEEGAVFEKHTDTEKVHGILGTLAIALPSPHAGGAVEAVFGGERRLLETAPTSDLDFSWLVWYADVEHAVQKITSGYRLVLTYNLVNRATGESRCAASLVNDKQMIVEALRDWNTIHQRCPRYWPLTYMLEHKYTEANLRFDHLKDHDRVRAHCLPEVCRKQGFSLFLANLERIISGTCEENYRTHYYDPSEEESRHHNIVDEEERSLQLKTIVLPNDTPFGDTPDDEHYEEDMGNARATTTHYYRETCLLVMPEDCRDVVFISMLQDEEKTQRTLKSLLNEVGEVKARKLDGSFGESPQQCQKKLERFCNIIIVSHRHLNISVYEAVVEAALLLDRPSLFAEFVKVRADSIPSSSYAKIGLALPFAVSKATNWLANAANAARKSQSVQEMWSVLCGIVSGVEISLRDTSKRAGITLDAVYAWLYSVLVARVTSSGPLGSEDIRVLVEASHTYQHGERFLLETVVPYIKREISEKQFVVVFLRAVHGAYKEGHFRKSLVADLHRELLSYLGPDLFNFDSSTSLSRRNRNYTIYGYIPIELDSLLTNCPRPGDFVALLEQCLSLELDDLYGFILQEFVLRSESIPLEAFDGVWLPILRQFLLMLNARLDEISAPHRDKYRHIFSTVLNNYVRRFLGVAPPKPTASIHVQRGCGCVECRAVDLILSSPGEQYDRFPRRKPIRDHLEKQFGRFYECVTQYSGSPHTLVIAKNEAEYKAKCAAESYEKRAEEARKWISYIGLPALNRLLGTAGTELVEFGSVRYKLIVAGRQRAPLMEMSATRCLQRDVCNEMSGTRCLQRDVCNEMSATRCLQRDVCKEMSATRYCRSVSSSTVDS